MLFHTAAGHHVLPRMHVALRHCCQPQYQTSRLGNWRAYRVVISRLPTPVRGKPMPCGGSARLNHPILMRQVGWQRTPQPPAFNAACGLAYSRKLMHVGHVAAPDPRVSGRADRGSWRLRTPTGVGSGVRRVASVGHVAAPDPGVSGRAHRGSWQLRTPSRVGSGIRAPWLARRLRPAGGPASTCGGSRTIPRGFGICLRGSGPVVAAAECFVLVDTQQHRTCHHVGSGPGDRCPHLSGLASRAQLSRGLVRGYG